MKSNAMSFYTFLMTLRNPDSTSESATFANAAFFDSGFPKQSCDYDEISSYLELNASYLASMTIFDDVWQLYQAKIA
ncbi:Uncharacterized protein YozE, UPF0346 family [Ligilactobacillus sp. WC1T17]|uniref:UPF0346 protein SAMN05216431_103102 n=1 Tax=Ligilactobacillus ruminis TaxID=1623 RepID=A0ABY1AA95_9LACO|nr:Uncharacterized protein YozE, UPF0346 family [Ligilactobacillus ruminis]